MKIEKTKKVKPLISIKEAAMSLGGGALIGNGVGDLLGFMIRDWSHGRTIGSRLIRSATVMGIDGFEIATGIILVINALKEVKEVYEKED